jgi:hypothetical protein
MFFIILTYPVTSCSESGYSILSHFQLDTKANPTFFSGVSTLIVVYDKITGRNNMIISLQAGLKQLESNRDGLESEIP